MHDGYLFTLGIGGTAAGNHPAPALLSHALGSIPPVKRAALLGEVVLHAGLPTGADPLIDQVLIDIRDAELLFIVTPVVEGHLPLRLQQLLVAAQRLDLAGKHALLITLRRGAAANHELAAFCAANRIVICANLAFVEDEALAAQKIQVEHASLAAYRMARRALPESVLPEPWN